MHAEATRERLLDAVADAARRAGVFSGVDIRDGRLVCHALGTESAAEYRLGWDEGQDAGLWVSLVTPDRWLSESIEADLMHTGDELEELLEEELVDQGLDIGRLAVEHFRSEDRLFTFRSRLPAEECDTATGFLLAYEACFRELGDMAGKAEDE